MGGVSTEKENSCVKYSKTFTMTSTLQLHPTSEISNSLKKEKVTNGGGPSTTNKTASDGTNGMSETTPESTEATASTSNKDESDEKKTEEITEEMKLKYANWPYRDIKEPHANDVLYGRGGTFLSSDGCICNLTLFLLYCIHNI